MKSIAGLSLFFSLLMAIIVSPLQAQDETDDLYINSRDIEKKKEKSKKEQVNPDRTYYNYPQPGNGQTGSTSAGQEQDKFSQLGYTNKYIEAEKTEGISSPSNSVNTAQPTTQNYEQSTQTENVKWYKNNKRNLKRKAYGSQYTIAPVVGYNNYGGWNTGVSFGWNSGWNNWYGWNSPYYNGWNNYGYGGFGGYGMNYGYGGYGFYDPYSFGNYYYSPGWFVGYNSYSGWGSGFGMGYGGGYGGYYNPYAWGAWGNPYYGWRPAVYVPVNTYSNNNGGGAKVNYGPIPKSNNVTNSNGGNSNGYTRPGMSSGNQRQENYNGVAPGNYNQNVRPRDYYSQPNNSQSAPSNQTRQSSTPQRGYDNGSSAPVYTNPRDNSQSRDQNYSRPTDNFRGYDNGSGRPYGGGGNSGGQRMEGGGGSFGGSTPSGGGNGGGNGGGYSRPR